MNSGSIKIVSEGRRHYITGNTYPIKDKLRSAGAKWDAERKAWWTGKREIADQFAGGSVEVATVDAPERPADAAPGTGAVVAGKATYKGKTYYIAGRVNRGRTHWDDGVDAITSRDGGRILLLFRDGSSQFWAARTDVQIGKIYDKPQTIARLMQFVEKAKQARAEGNSDGIPNGATYECEECGERVVRGQGRCWETGCSH